MPNSVLLKARGLYTFPNLLSEVPSGALTEADNVVINRESIIESRRGLKLYGSAMASAIKQLAVYKERILRHFGTTIQFDNGSGTFTSFTGSFTEAETGLRIKSVEMNGNLFFTTSSGIKKISALTGASLAAGSVSNAGGIKALDIELSLNTDPGFFLQDSKVAYRLVWGIKDANNNIILGSPSGRAVITNASQNLLITDVNNLLTELDAAAIVSGADDLSDTNYNSTLAVAVNSSASVIQTSLSSLCTKLNTDLSTADFSTIKTAIDALTFSDPTTTSQWQALQNQYDAIVAQLNTYITGGVKISNTVTPFSTHTDSATVEITATIPSGITTSHFYQLYRTALVTATGVFSINDLADPTDELQLVYENNPTSGEISTGTVTIHDITPQSFMGANLYTNINSGEGDLQANEIPPYAKDIAAYKNTLFFANTKTKQRKQLSLLSVDDLVAATSTITITDGTTTNTYTFDTTEDAVTKKVKIDTSDSVAQSVDATAKSLVRVINKNSSEIVNAFYMSGPLTVPGLILLEAKSLTTTAFNITSNSSATGNEFNPVLPISGATVISDNEVSPNRVFFSKQFQPEAVPIINYFDVGPKDKKILRILGLRDSLFIIKEEGIYRLSGEFGGFVVSLFDSSTLLTASDSAVILNNQIYMLTDQGVATISDTGVSIISRAIETDLIKLSIPSYTNFSTASFGLSDESDRSYYLWTVTSTSDTFATQCYRYNTFTTSWTRLPISKSCGIVNPTDGKLYLGATDVNYIEQERKNFDRTDYADREYTLTVNDVSSDVVTLDSVANISVGDVIVQTQYLTLSQYNRLLMKLDTDYGVTDTNYYSLLGAAAGDNLRTKLDAVAAKLDADTGVTDNNYASTISGYTSSFADTQDAFNAIVIKLNADLGVAFSNYTGSGETVTFEVIVNEVNSELNQITIQYEYPLIEGPLTSYEHIETKVTYAPQTFGDPSLSKQVREATMIFERKSFTNAVLSFASDVSPGFESINFTGSGNGIFGSSVFGNQTFGGQSSSAPFRTYIPREKQRCRYINCRFEHATAREAFAIFGLSLTGEPVSTRAYR